MADLTLAAVHAANFWFRPCADNIVWAKTRAINLAQEALAFKVPPAEWVGRFLFMPEGNFLIEGLYLIPAVQAGIGTLRVNRFRSAKFRDRKFICSWHDSVPTKDEGLMPKYHGLNDCAHFVSECLKAGGVTGVGSPSAAQLVANLRARADTKTLALAVSKGVARRIVNSGIMTPGDVIAFSDGNRFRHTTLFLGDKSIAMHTTINHPAQNIFEGEDEENWVKSANDTHPLVTLIHFNYKDRDPAAAPWLPGWWQVTIGGQVFFYHFTNTGKAAWTSQRPAGLSSPPSQPGGKGYWFVKPEGDVEVCWTSTGTLDFLLRTSGPSTRGFSGGGSELTAVRLGP